MSTSTITQRPPTQQHQTKPVTKPDESADQLAADLVNGVGKVIFSPLMKFRNALDNLSKRENSIPSPEPTLKGFIEKIKDYHRRVCPENSGKIEKKADALLKYALKPLTFCKTGRAIQENVSTKLAAFVRITTFAFLTVLPYLAFTAFLAGSYLLYLASPVALISLFAGTVLLIHMYQTYLLVQGVQQVNERLETETNKLKDVIKEGVELVNETLQNKSDNFIQKGEKAFKVVDAIIQKTTKFLGKANAMKNAVIEPFKRVVRLIRPSQTEKNPVQVPSQPITPPESTVIPA